MRADTPNQMICLRPDGTEEVLFAMEGSKEIYMAGGRLYLSSDVESYSVNMDGSGKRDYGYMQWLAPEDDGKGVIGYDGQKLYRIDGESGDKEELADDLGGIYNYYFPGTVDGCLYFSCCDNTQNNAHVW